MLTELGKEQAVKGISLIRYGDDKRLSLRQRLELFISVCRAVQSAHYKGILHGALNPSNVLIDTSGGKPIPKIMDFGAAATRRQRLMEALQGGAPGIRDDQVEYLSPELADLNAAADIDTRGDVYSLGVLLYELLTGTLPVPREKLQGAALPEVLRRIREEEIPKPSERVREAKERPKTPPPHQMEPSELANTLRGELDAVVMKALQKDRGQRYQTANELASDLQRYLDGEPVDAYPTSGADRMWKEAKKHPRGLAAAVALVLLLLAAGIAGAFLTVQARHAETLARTTQKEAEEQRERAQKEVAEAENQRKDAETRKKEADDERDEALAAAAAARSSAQASKGVLDFFNDKVLSASRPQGWAGSNWASVVGKTMTLLQATDGAEKQVTKAFADQPMAEAMIREILGTTYKDLGEPAKAVKQYERALALREVIAGPNDAATSACRNELDILYRRANRPDDASRLHEDTPNTPTHAEALAIRGSMLLGQKKFAEAEAKLRECLAIREKLQPDDWTTFATKSMLGEALLDQKKYDEAEPLLVSGYQGLKQREAKILPQDKFYLTKALERLVKLHENAGKQEKAAQWRKELELAKAAQSP